MLFGLFGRKAKRRRQRAECAKGNHKWSHERHDLTTGLSNWYCKRRGCDARKGEVYVNPADMPELVLTNVVKLPVGEVA